MATISPTLLHDYKITLQTFQSERLRRDHADLAVDPQYQAIGEFFFTEMYGPRDFSNRDSQARRLLQFVNVIPGLTLRDVEPALSLLDLSNRLDDEVIACLVELDAPLTFDEHSYERAYRLADNYDLRHEQLELVRTALYNVHHTAHNPLIRLTLERTSGLAERLGMADIHTFLRKGHEAIQPVRDIYRFVETVYVREKDRLDRIYER
jgi:hypothetical protein